MIQNIRFEDWEAERMRDPEFRTASENLEPAYQVARLRIMRGLTQEQLAGLVGTRQSSIARLESGKSEPRLSFLRRIAEALGAILEVQIVPQEEISVVEPSYPAMPIRWEYRVRQEPVSGTSYAPVRPEYKAAQVFNNANVRP